MNKQMKLRQKQKKQIAALTFIMLIASVLAILLLTPLFDVHEINVYGNSVLKKEDIIRNAGIVTDENIYSVSLRKVKNNIKQMGYIDDVKVRRRFPDRIDITVSEEVGVAYIPAKNGYVIISAQERAIDFISSLRDTKNTEDSDNIKTYDMPIVNGLKNVRYKIGAKIVSDDTSQLDALAVCLEEFSKDGYIFDMTGIDVSNLSDIRFTYGSALVVKLGGTEKISYKMELFPPILEEIGTKARGTLDLQRKTFSPETKKSK